MIICKKCEEPHTVGHGEVCIFCFYGRNVLCLDDVEIKRKDDMKKAQEQLRYVSLSLLMKNKRGT